MLKGSGGGEEYRGSHRVIFGDYVGIVIRMHPPPTFPQAPASLGSVGRTIVDRSMDTRFRV